MNTHVVGSRVHGHHVYGYQVAKRVRAATLWMVRSGGNMVGPVSIELLERGLAAGKIPADAEMALMGRHEWRRVAEILPASTFMPAPSFASPPTLEGVPAAPEAAPAQRRVASDVPPPPASVRYPEEPVSVPTQGVLAAMFG